MNTIRKIAHIRRQIENESFVSQGAEPLNSIFLLSEILLDLFRVDLSIPNDKFRAEVKVSVILPLEEVIDNATSLSRDASDYFLRAERHFELIKRQCTKSCEYFIVLQKRFSPSIRREGES